VEKVSFTVRKRADYVPKSGPFTSLLVTPLFEFPHPQCIHHPPGKEAIPCLEKW
jgi:hypothetical protein